MQVLIKIDEARFKDIQRIAEVQLEMSHFQTAEQMIANGIPIPDDATNGDSVKKIFCKGIVRINSRKNVSVEFNKDWWYRSYQKGGKE